VHEFDTHFSFEAEIPAGDGGDEPPGTQLLDALEYELEARGVRILERGVTDYSHRFDVACDRRVFTGMLGPVGDGRWLVFVESTLGWKRLFRISDAEEYATIANAVREALEASALVSRVTGYRDADHWNRGHTDTGGDRGAAHRSR
jgi:hypothetical protein